MGLGSLRRALVPSRLITPAEVLSSTVPKWSRGAPLGPADKSWLVQTDKTERSGGVSHMTCVVESKKAHTPAHTHFLYIRNV